MNSFFRMFFASLLALVVFSVISFLFFLGLISILASPAKVETGSRAVLVVDLSRPFPEVGVKNPLAFLSQDEQYDIPSVYDVVRMIEHARNDTAVKGILLQCSRNANGFGSSEDIRNALRDFKTSGKFIYAYGEVITQGGYYVATVADKIFCHPQGGLDWRGYSMQYIFLKGTLEKLEIEPQIFYAGKFKSATEPFREKKMTDANRLQSTEILNDMYGYFLGLASASRGRDTAELHKLAEENAVRFPANAVEYGLVDGLKYDDQLQDELRQVLKLKPADKINFVPLGKYADAVDFKARGRDKIAVIYAQGDIIDGKGDQNMIGSESYLKLVRNARTDKTIKAIVFRINSGGGSALASEEIWRELSLAKKEKPVVVSFGDVAASGAYYLSCNADSIFAQPNTITGSIGVFSIIPNMQSFFDHKLGVTFDGVKTARDADALSIFRPLTETQKKYLQEGVDSIYFTFKSRVAGGRRKSLDYVDSIGQGRIWSGTRALQLGLVDRIGGLNEAIECAARMAKTQNYRLREYPEPKNIFDLLMGGYRQEVRHKALLEELGPEGVKTFEAARRWKQWQGVTLARLPFDCIVE